MFQFEREQSCNLYLKILKVLFIYLFYIFIRQPIQYSSAKHLIIKSFLPYLNGCDATFHYTDVIMSTMASQITSLTIVYLIFYSGTDQRNIKVPRHRPFCGEFTDDRWIPRTKGQLRGKYFHLITSSCANLVGFYCENTKFQEKMLNGCAVVVFILFQLDHRGLVTWNEYVRKMSHHSFR